MPSIRVVFVDVHWLGSDGVVEGPGFLYLRGGRIAALEPGEPWEEAQYSEMVAGGPGRLVVPGFAGIVVPESYALRWLPALEAARELLEGGRLAEAISGLGYWEAYSAALMAAADAGYNGFTRLIALTPNPGPVAKAVTDAGLEAVILVPQGCGGLDAGIGLHEALEEARRSGADMTRLEFVLLDCKKEGEGAWSLKGGCLSSPQGRRWCPPPWSSGLPAFIAAGAAAPWPLLSGAAGPGSMEAYRALTLEAHREAVKDYEPLTGTAGFMVLDASEPPGWLPLTPGVNAVAALGPSRPRLETLVAGGRMVIDGGEHLLVGSDAAAEARRKLRRVVEKLGRL